MGFPRPALQLSRREATDFGLETRLLFAGSSLVEPHEGSDRAFLGPEGQPWVGRGMCWRSAQGQHLNWGPITRRSLPGAEWLCPPQIGVRA